MATGTIELTGQADFPACPCCGVPARRVWGNLIDDAGTTAYVVQWAPGNIATHAAAFGLVFGPWGDGSSAADRVHVALDYRRVGGKPQLVVIDAATSPIDARPLAAKLLTAAEVSQHPVAPLVTRYVDQIWARDARVAELHRL